MEASRRGDMKAVQEILMSDPSQCRTPNADGATPLMVAAMMGHIQVWTGIYLSLLHSAFIKSNLKGYTVHHICSVYSFVTLYFSHFDDLVVFCKLLLDRKWHHLYWRGVDHYGY